MAGVIIRDLSKKYNIRGKPVDALSRINLSIKDGSFVTIVGKSGCGKTTLLRILCGLEEKTSGEIIFKPDSNECDKKINIGIVFQEPRLMPWLTIEQNMSFSLLETENKSRRKERVHEYLEMLGLKDFKDAYPAQVSGGMAQRAALGRTLCYDPDLILMDEPLGALDAFNRRKLQDELMEIFFNKKKTIVFVTHDVNEAVYLGQKVIVMDSGKITDEMPVDFSYPRPTKTKAYFDLTETILQLILNSKNN